jgi:hypothetical protein
LKGLNYGMTVEDTERVMEKAGITKKDAQELLEKMNEEYPAMAENWMTQRTEKLNRELSHFGTHVLKTWPKYFEAVYFGEKTFEVRKNDRNFQVGDVLVLREWDPETEEYSGRKMEVKVTYMMHGSEHTVIDDGYVIMGIKRQL